MERDGVTQIGTIRCADHQRGSVAIEFAFVFPVLFVVIYAIAAYSLAFLTTQNFTYASEEILRISLREGCEDCDATGWENHILNLATNASYGLDADGNPDPALPKLILFADAADITDNVNCVFDADLNGLICELSFSTPPVLDGITMPGFGKMPSLPDNLIGRASLLM